MAKKKAPEKKLERVYNIPLRREWIKTAKYRRAKKAVTGVKNFLAKHMKVELSDVKIGPKLNHELWKHGIKNPPHHVKVTAVKEAVEEKDIVKAELEGVEFKTISPKGKVEKSPGLRGKLEKALGARKEEKEETGEKKELEELAEEKETKKKKQDKILTEEKVPEGKEPQRQDIETSSLREESLKKEKDI
ncbi:50S ribosomal protein L31e [Candidatus Woesearchaeota archaeon]|nr:50S ribosomal protein L31e [Candidatus Woesearchaeota archaeon]